MKTKSLTFKRKAQASLGDLPNFVQIFVVAGIFLGVGALVLAEFETSVDDGTNNQSVNAINNATQGLVELASFLPIIGLVIAAVILLGVVLAIRAR